MITYKTFFIFIHGVVGEFNWKIKRKDGSTFEESNKLSKFITEDSAENAAKARIDEWST